MVTFEEGDIVRVVGTVRKGGLRLMVRHIFIQPGVDDKWPDGWASFIPVRKDGKVDRRWTESSSSFKGKVKGSAHEQVVE